MEKASMGMPAPSTHICSEGGCMKEGNRSMLRCKLEIFGFLFEEASFTFFLPVFLTAGFLQYLVL